MDGEKSNYDNIRYAEKQISKNDAYKGFIAVSLDRLYHERKLRDRLNEEAERVKDLYNALSLLGPDKEHDDKVKSN
ncbi:hypothetical protein GE107_09200 [Cohnella sp. CFH 77786]|uniref:hypothetical protein n=1 Tax=Cohnella sp. CFH 77786 TaxID=2662265 RepID=UPI001C60A249|nr:hypothetical protein [Cohnella sp. CFH 77786]MBW5446234.1 hypothetical protein [Cohnella sp. CFH 77786]